jgi:intein/homing endonuclease
MASIVPFSANTQCIDKDENVYLKDGTIKRICDVVEGDEVITFDPQNQKQSVATVTYAVTKPTEKQLFELKTISGRSIKATFDHQFMTNDGWKKICDIPLFSESSDVIEAASLVAISLEPLPVSTEVEDTIILTKEDFIISCRKINLSERRTKNYLDILKDVLPLKSSSYELIIVARLYGFSIADGWIGISKTDERIETRFAADFGHEYSCETFTYDLLQLGLQRPKMRYTTKEGFGNTYRVEYSGALPALLIALGASYGSKTQTGYNPVPTWIMNGSDMVKREFLSGFQGGDGSKIKNNSSKQLKIQIGTTSRSVKMEFINTLDVFLNQVVTLLRHFNIIVFDVKLKKSTTYDNIIIGSYFISNSRINLINYYDTIGYRYDVLKNVESGILVEYLKYVEQIFIKRKELVEKVRSLRLTMLPSKISEVLKISINEIRNVLALEGNIRSLPARGKYINVDQWISIVKHSSTTIFVPVIEKKMVENCMISDITIDSKNQSFLCGDRFCVHNSPRVIYQCLDPDELVVMGDYTKKAIKDIKVGDEVISVNPKTFERTVTKVINHYVKETSKKVLTLYTCTGRKLTCTEDHPVLTLEGWKAAKDAKEICVIMENGAADEIQKYYQKRINKKIKSWYKSYCDDREKVDNYNKTTDSLKIPYDHGSFSQHYFYLAPIYYFDPLKVLKCPRKFMKFFPDIVRKVNRPEKHIIADITTESENHSFIAGDSFVVHNSSMGKMLAQVTSKMLLV